MAVPNDDNAVIEEVCALLGRVKKWKWRTTSALERELKMSAGTLYPVLERHVSDPKRKIRYHKYPSRSLEVLWGLVDTVGERADLPPLRRVDPPSESGFVGVGPSIFISHAHADEETAKKIGERIANAKGQPWLFEMEIETDQPIIGSVKETIQKCQGAIVFVSCSALGSLWVHKEFGRTLNGLNPKTLVVLDDQDVALLQAVGNRNIGDIEQCVRARGGSDDQIRRSHDFADDLFARPIPMVNLGDETGIEDWLSSIESTD
jgi:hypothetical protein